MNTPKRPAVVRRLPERIYVERWPEELERPDTIHYEPTGYGIDMASGLVSRITVYVRETNRLARPAQRKGKR